MLKRIILLPKLLEHSWQALCQYFIGSEAHLGANSFNHSYPTALVFGIEVLASALLMAVVLAVVYTKGLRGLMV
jgi:hypothetical protein